MTHLRFQRVELRDCESRIAREYFEWGKLPSEPAWEDAPDVDRTSIIVRGHSLYDGCPIPQDNRVTVSDVASTMTIYSRVNVDDIKYFLRGEAILTTMLERIPPTLSLINAADSEIRMVGSQIDAFRNQSRGIQLSKATKVLHRKRPEFIPLIDDNVRFTLWKNFPHLLQEGSATEAYLILYRDLTLRERDELVQIESHVQCHWGVRITLVRILSFLLYQWWKTTALPKNDFRALWGSSDYRRLAEISWQGERR